MGQQTGGPVLGVALFCCRRRGKRLEEDTLHLHNSSSEHTHHWYNTLKEQIKGNMNNLIFIYSQVILILTTHAVCLLPSLWNRKLTQNIKHFNQGEVSWKTDVLLVTQIRMLL